MITFEISVNGKLLYHVGVGDFGILTAEVMWAHIQQQAGSTHEQLTVNATSMANDLHSAWSAQDLKVGDEVSIRIVDSEKYDEPSESHEYDKKTS